ncbi:MAG TPA: SURF1 family protein [Methylophilus sp.]|nr:SURF1 family protein [Methylophilus sp.]
MLGTIITIVSIPLFIKLGLWQYHKATLKQSIQEKYASTDSEMPNLKDYLDIPEQLKYRKVIVRGNFETKYQFLLDNQVEAGRAGFHIITPFQIADTQRYVLVNRGWVAGFAEHEKLPRVDTPLQMMEIMGMVWTPSDKIFSLEQASKVSDKQDWQVVWQNLDMKKFKASTPINTLPVIIKMDPASSGGFVRNWRVPSERIMTHLGYAYQWFGFALATFMIYLYLSIRRLEN